MSTLIIDKRFNGPVASGNGGYSAGLAAQLLSADAVEATLRAAIPLGQTLRAHPSGDGLDIMTDDASNRILIMSLKPATLAAPTIRAPTLAAAAHAAESFRGAEDHVLPTCFVCGPARSPGDGLCIFPDFVADADNPNTFPIVAAPWTPSFGLADATGQIAPEFLWAALDCPGAFAINKEPILLGRMTARLFERPRPGAPLIAVAWDKGSDRRKHFAGTALFTERGDLVACSEQTWIQIDQHAHVTA
jgi:hypothetical protein